MKRSPALLALLLATTALPAAGDADTRNEIEVGLGRENLDNQREDWRENFASFTRRDAENRTWIGRLAKTRRFDQNDSNLQLSGYFPMVPGTTGLVEVDVSTTHRVLPTHRLRGEISQSLPHGFGIASGLRHITYNHSSSDGIDLTLERYFGDFRIAYTYDASRSDRAGHADGHRVQGSYYYGEGSRATLAYSTGTEVDRPEAGITQSTRVKGFALYGRHMFRKDRGIGYALTRNRQESLFTRDGLAVSFIQRF